MFTETVNTEDVDSVHAAAINSQWSTQLGYFVNDITGMLARSFIICPVWGIAADNVGARPVLAVRAQ